MQHTFLIRGISLLSPIYGEVFIAIAFFDDFLATIPDSPELNELFLFILHYLILKRNDDITTTRALAEEHTRTVPTEAM